MDKIAFYKNEIQKLKTQKEQIKIEIDQLYEEGQKLEQKRNIFSAIKIYSVVVMAVSIIGFIINPSSLSAILIDAGTFTLGSMGIFFSSAKCNKYTSGMESNISKMQSKNDEMEKLDFEIYKRHNRIKEIRNAYGIKTPLKVVEHSHRIATANRVNDTDLQR